MDSDKSAQFLFQIVIDDIRYSKKQQWYVLYLTLIALAGIISVVLNECAVINGQYNVSVWPFGYVSLTRVVDYIFFVGLVGLISYEYIICRYRKKKDELIQKLGLDCAIKEIYTDSNKLEKGSKYTFFLIFIIVIAIGYFITKTIITK